MNKPLSILLWILSTICLLAGVITSTKYLPAAICFILIGLIINPLIMRLVRFSNVAAVCFITIISVALLVVGIAVLVHPYGKGTPNTETFTESVSEVEENVPEEAGAPITESVIPDNIAEQADDITPEPEVVEDSDISETPVPTDDNASNFSVHFIDVGQGDCTLICCDNHYMLIDAGPDDQGSKIQLYLKKQGIKALDYLVLTHPDADHIGSADVIITKFDIGQILVSPYPKDNEFCQDVLDSMAYKNYSAETPGKGDSLSLGSAKVTILQCDLYNDSNNSSIILMVQYGENRFLFTGDAENQAEYDLLQSGQDLKADVYHAGHHGSYTASSYPFVTAVSPEYAVISCGTDNSYGHPHQEVLDTFKEQGIKIFRLDEQGTVVAYSDGNMVSWSTNPSDDYTGGSYQYELDNDIITPEGNQDNPNHGSEYGTAPEGAVFIGNKKSLKLHLATCNGLPQQQNQELFDTIEEAIAAGYTKDNQCLRCMPFDNLQQNP